MFQSIKEKIKAVFNPAAWVAALIKPSQFSSLARTIVKVMAGALLGAGFSQEVVANFSSGVEPVVTGLLALAVGVVASYLTHKPAKAE